MAKYTEKILFRVFKMPCCGQLLCWVNPRLPSHCPECGKMIFLELRKYEDAHIIIRDENATLNYKE